MFEYIIKSDRLQVKIEVADEDYRGARFDRMGRITEVILDDKDSFAAKESLIDGLGSGGQGFCNEFGIEEAIGYDDIPIGDKFLKIGVGALTKDTSAAYDFSHNYAIDPFPYDVMKKESSITFKSESHNINGYAVKYVKTIRVDDNEMIVEYFLENTGDKTIETTEYCHNFVSINKKKIGPDYNLKFSYPLDIDVAIGSFEVDKHNITWEKFVEEMFYLKLKNVSKSENQFFELLHLPSNVGFRETSKFEIERVAVWGMPHVVSPESFIKIKVEANEMQSWERVYNFFN